MAIYEIAGCAFIFTGLFLVFTGSLGILRFKGFFARLHPAGVVDSLGAPCVLLGLIIFDEFSKDSIKLGILVIILLLTTPTACHALAKAGYGPNHQK